VKPPGHLAPEDERKNYQKAKAGISRRDVSNLRFLLKSHGNIGDLECMSFGKIPDSPTHFLNKFTVTGSEEAPVGEYNNRCKSVRKPH
jgi:hypothetical protein